MNDFIGWLQFAARILFGFIIGSTIATLAIKYTQWIWRVML